MALAYKEEKLRKEKEARRAARRKAKNDAAAVAQSQAAAKRPLELADTSNPSDEPPAKRVRFGPGAHPDENTHDDTSRSSMPFSQLATQLSQGNDLEMTQDPTDYVPSSPIRGPSPSSEMNSSRPTGGTQSSRGSPISTGSRSSKDTQSSKGSPIPTGSHSSKGPVGSNRSQSSKGSPIPTGSHSSKGPLGSKVSQISNVSQSLNESQSSKVSSASTSSNRPSLPEIVPVEVTIDPDNRHSHPVTSSVLEASTILHKNLQEMQDAHSKSDKVLVSIQTRQKQMQELALQVANLKSQKVGFDQKASQALRTLKEAQRDLARFLGAGNMQL
eukprot:931648_1